jgi:serine/threonine-protein kinase
VFLLAVTGSGAVTRLTTSEQIQFPSSWSPDGSLIAFTQIGLQTGSDIWTVSVDGEKPRPFLLTPFNESGGVFSPDGNWMAYVSDESGREEVYVQRYPDGGGKRQLSSEGGVNPVWPRTGDRLFYRRDRSILAVTVSTAPAFRAASPQLFVSTPYSAGGAVLAVPNYDVEPGSGGIVVVEEGEVHPPTRIHVVLNWFEELKQRVGK